MMVITFRADAEVLLKLSLQQKLTATLTFYKHTFGLYRPFFIRRRRLRFLIFSSKPSHFISLAIQASRPGRTVQLFLRLARVASQLCPFAKIGQFFRYPVALICDASQDEQ